MCLLTETPYQTIKLLQPVASRAGIARDLHPWPLKTFIFFR
jgi:hypothetical protein